MLIHQLIILMNMQNYHKEKDLSRSFSFTNINKNLNDVFSKEVFIKNNSQKNSEFLNNNKYFYLK